METVSARPSPFSSTAQGAAQRNPPLAPSQELAYREKCIQLKRRLSEIEASNDEKRRKLDREKRFHDKLRLNRTLLLNHLKQVMEATDKKLSQQELVDMSARMRSGDYIMDETSAESEEEEEEEEEPEPQLPASRKRRRDSAHGQDAVMSAAVGASVTGNHAGQYHQSSLPSLAPAHSHSPAVHNDQQLYTSSFRVASSNSHAATPTPAQYTIQQPPSSAPSFSQHHSPLPQQYSTPTPAMAPMEPNLPPLLQPPVRPRNPFDQFTEHMTPQLLDDNYTQSQLPDKIRELWNSMNAENKGLWDARYNEQMVDYERAMDDYKRGRKHNPTGFAPAIR